MITRDGTLTVGDSLSRKIDHGLAESKFGIVVISPAFLQKNWPEYELRGLVSREIDGEKVILPIWHNVTRAQVLKYSPPLADKLALNTEGKAAVSLTNDLLKVIRPDLYQQFLRAVLARSEALKTVRNYELSKIMPGPIRHQTLPQDLVARIIGIHAMTEDLLPMSLAETINTFRRDATPEGEIRAWERIVACLYIATVGERFSEPKRRDIFAVLLAASLGPVEDREQELRGALTADEFKSLIILYDSNLSEVNLDSVQNGRK